MITALEPDIPITKEQEEQMYWDDWKFNSHHWIETFKGYYACKFCNTTHTSAMPTNTKKLCVKNPYVQEVVKSIVDTINENY